MYKGHRWDMTHYIISGLNFIIFQMSVGSPEVMPMVCLYLLPESK